MPGAQMSEKSTHKERVFFIMLCDYGYRQAQKTPECDWQQNQTVSYRQAYFLSEAGGGRGQRQTIFQGAVQDAAKRVEGSTRSKKNRDFSGSN
jgi:hypothetical protein